MRRQTGIAMIAIYALLALGGVVALVGWWEYHNYQIRAAERAKWKAAMEVCESNTATAVGANKTLQASADALAAKVAEQNDRIAALQKQEAAARQARDTALAAALAKEQSLRAEVARLTVIANRPAVPATPEVCDEARDLLRAVAAGRL